MVIYPESLLSLGRRRRCRRPFQMTISASVALAFFWPLVGAWKGHLALHDGNYWLSHLLRIATLTNLHPLVRFERHTRRDVKTPDTSASPNEKFLLNPLGTNLHHVHNCCRKASLSRDIIELWISVP
uniref:Uncharacterized protein n=1 Tax=Pseudictyota dubia TaxID=2749911 RepID=A0A7R9ZIA4_9STRA